LDLRIEANRDVELARPGQLDAVGRRRVHRDDAQFIVDRIVPTGNRNPVSLDRYGGDRPEDAALMLPCSEGVGLDELELGFSPVADPENLVGNGKVPPVLEVEAVLATTRREEGVIDLLEGIRRGAIAVLKPLSVLTT
jgi:hypothetical protein